jgi:hypothetical protein
MANFFQTNDLFKHPTNASGGSYWPHGDSVNDFSNTENYGSTTAASWASIIQKLWNGYLKPAIVGESTNSNAHINLWSTLSTGIAITPLMWQFNANSSVWSPTITANWPPVVAFVKGINFAGLTNLKQAIATVTGATAYGISSDQITFGWITGTFSGKSLSATGLANGASTLEWWNTTAGTIVSTSAVTVTGGALTAAIPASTAADIAFKIISPAGVGTLHNNSPLAGNDQQAISYEHGALRLTHPLSGSAEITITSVQGRAVARLTISGTNISSVPFDRMKSGVYFARITSGKGSLVQKVIVASSK